MDHTANMQAIETAQPGAAPNEFSGLQHALHRSGYADQIKSGVKTVRNLDAIDQLEVPSAWGVSEVDTINQRLVSFHGPQQGASQIGFVERDRPVAAASASAFETIVNGNAGTPRTLYTDDLAASPQSKLMFKSLANALGLAQVGDNQLTSQATGPDSRQPAFHLSRARVIDVNGKNALAIDGWYTQMDGRAQPKTGPDGPQKRYYSGIFIDADGKGTRVDEMYLTADNQAAFVANKGVFSSVTKSIKWR